MSGFTNIIEADNFCVYIKNVGNIAETIFPEYRGGRTEPQTSQDRGTMPEPGQGGIK